MIEHFAGPPNWNWYILFYFFLGGISGGGYALGTLLRLVDRHAYAGASRAAYIVSWPLLLICPILLAVDLGRPARFWHMLIDAGGGGAVFRYRSPMSVGAWALLIFGVFSTISFIEAVGQDGGLAGLGRGFARAFGGVGGDVIAVIGSLFGLYIAGYTGVLLSVSNQPIWSDSWVVGGLFLASALSSAVAAIALVSQVRGEAASMMERLGEADRYFIIIEIVLLALFLITLGRLARPAITGVYGAVLWVVAVILGMLLPLLVYWRTAIARLVPTAAVSVLVLIGVLALRGVILFSAQV